METSDQSHQEKPTQNKVQLNRNWSKFLVNFIFWSVVILVVVLIYISPKTPNSQTQSYLYCWDTGDPRPHHFGHRVAGDHLCSDEELKTQTTTSTPIPSIDPYTNFISSYFIPVLSSSWEYTGYNGNVPVIRSRVQNNSSSTIIRVYLKYTY